MQPAITTSSPRIGPLASSSSHVSDEIPWDIFQQTSANQMILSHYSDAPPMPSGIQLITYDELEEMERAASQQTMDQPAPVQTVRSIATEFFFMTARALAQAFNLG